MLIKDIYRKLRFGHKATSEDYVNYLRSLGMSIGEDVFFYAPLKTLEDTQYPWQISIGNHVKITQGVILLTHDYSWSVMKRVESDGQRGCILGASGNLTIGNNVFIGMNAIVLRGVTIGNDVIIGAGSVVAKDCESGWVYAGNPAKKIISIQDYLKKRQGAQLREAKELWVSYKNRYGKRPTREVFHEYFMLFESPESLDEKQIEKMKLCGNYEDSIDYMNNHKAPFCSFEEFALYCEEKGIDKNRVKMDECK